MKELNAREYHFVTGAGADSYMQAVNLEIAQIMAAKFYQCNIKDLSESMIASALTGGMAGAFGGGVALPVVGTVPGWLAGAASGAGMAAFTYGVSCWW